MLRSLRIAHYALLRGFKAGESQDHQMMESIIGASVFAVKVIAMLYAAVLVVGGLIMFAGSQVIVHIADAMDRRENV